MPDHPTLPSEAGEEWRAVAGFEGAYEVSSLGRVRSLDRTITCANRWGGVSVKRLRGKMLKLLWDTAGYQQVCLYRDSQGTPRPVHKLVAVAFIGRCPDGEEVRHGPNGKLDNRASQLCYGTPDDQKLDMLRDGTQIYGEEVKTAKLTAEIVMECRRRVANGESKAALALEFGVSKSAMGFAVTGRNWGHLPGAIAFELVTHCPALHEYTEANTYVSPGSGDRHCIACRYDHRDAQNARRRIRRRADAAAARENVTLRGRTG